MKVCLCEGVTTLTLIPLSTSSTEQNTPLSAAATATTSGNVIYQQYHNNLYSQPCTEKNGKEEEQNP